MSTNVGKKNIAHKGSKHGIVAPAAMSLVSPPAPPVPTPFPYTARSANASNTNPGIKVGDNEVLVEGSTMELNPPANQPAQSGGGDVVTHATKHIAVMITAQVLLKVGGRGICATGDIAALNVLTKEAKIAQMQLPLLEGGDFDIAKESTAAAAKMNRFYRRAYPPSMARQTRAGHPVDLGTGYVVDNAVDLRLPGLIPLVFSRSYCSAASCNRGALGKGGWTHSFEQWIEPTDTGFRFYNEEGLPVEFGPARDDGLSFHRGERLKLRKNNYDRTFEVRSLDTRLIRSFSPLPSGRIALRSIRDSRLHEIRLEYEGERLTCIIDSVKREVRLTYDDRARLTRVEVWAAEPGSGRAPSLQAWFEYAYHAEGELASHTNALGHAESWEYDGLHRMIKATLRNGVSFYYAYDEDSGHCVRTWGDGGLHDVRIEIDFEKGETSTHGTNRARRYLFKNGIVYREETFGGEWSTTRAYDEDEALVAVQNGAGETTKYELDDRGNLTRETDAAGNVQAWEYHDDLPTRYLSPTGLETRYAHDHHGTLIGITYPTGLSYTFELDREGRPCAVHGREGVRVRRGYDEHNNLCTETSGLGATTTYRYDALGRPVEKIDALGRKSRVEYDRLGRIIGIYRPDGTQAHAAYDRLGNLARFTDALGQVTLLEYAGTGRLARLTRADGQVYRFTYDSDERLVQIMNPRMEKYEFDYDRADQVVAERTFDDRLLSYCYNRAGRIARVNFPEGEWREFSYDKLGNVLENRGDDVQIALVRDALGRVEKATCQDVTGKVVTELERDRFGRLIADIQNGRAVRYEYDERGRRSARILPDGERTEYQYDHENLFTGVTHEGSRVSIERDVLGRERTRHVMEWKVESEHDAMDRLLSQKVVAPDPDVGAPKILAERRYAYDAEGRLKSINGAKGGLITYRYDRIDQLLEASSVSVREVFEYDPAGSLTNVLSGLGETGERARWSLAPGNQLRATSRARYVNDDRGRRIQRIERADGKDPREHPPRGDERITTYGWDTLDRLREVVLPGGSRIRFTYDAFGRRVRKDVLGPNVSLDGLLRDTSRQTRDLTRKTVNFLWDSDALCEEQDTSCPEPARKRVHVHEPRAWKPLLQIERGEVLAVICDHLGTPTELVNTAGRIVWRAAHGAWGDVLDEARDRGSQEVASPFRLLGQYEDSETGLCYTRFRYFEARTARWLSPDPLGTAGGINLLGFNGSPTLHSDPLGLCSNSGTEDLTGHRKDHILNRHRPGAGKSERTEFPAGWTDKQILHAVSDVATDPNSAKGSGAYGGTFFIGIRDGIVIRVDLFPANHPDGTPHPHAGKISTGYPTNTPQNP